MTVSDPAMAERSLNHIGFHRLSADWKPFEFSHSKSSRDAFQKGTSCRIVLNRYLFDQRLRSHLLEAFSFNSVQFQRSLNQNPVGAPVGALFPPR